MKPGIRFFMAVVIFFMVNDAISQQITYSGVVTYSSRKTKTANGGGSDKGINWNINVDERYIVDASFYVTFTGGQSQAGLSMFQLTSVEEINLVFDWSVSNNADEEIQTQSCFDGKMKFTHHVSPGDSKIYKHGVRTTMKDRDKPIISGGCISLTPGSYSLMLSGEIPFNIEMMESTTETFPCREYFPPTSGLSSKNDLKLPLAIVAEKKSDDFKNLEGTKILFDKNSSDCKECLSSVIGRMNHGETTCSYNDKTVISWTLIKRSKECDADLSYAKGDVKINGVSMKEGNTKISAGDLISTGDNSRMQINMPSGNEAIRLGSNSQFIVKDPCNLKPRELKDPHSSGFTILKGKLYYLVYKAVGNGLTFFPRAHTAHAGVRGQIKPDLPLLYASADPDFIPSLDQQNNQFFAPYLDQQNDPEKVELIKGYQSLSDNQTAFYLDYEDGMVQDVSALKGTIRIEDNMGLKSIDLPEGTSVSQWEDGTPMTEIVILTR